MDRAAEWAVLAEYGEMTPEKRAELDAWLAADRRHRGAFLRARAGLYVTEDTVIGGRPAPASSPAAPASINDNDGRQDAAPLRRGILRWGGRTAAGGTALAACLAVLMLLGVPVLSHFLRHDAGSVANVQKLADGSIATLDRDAEIAVALTPDYRRITLLKGAASFQVFHDKSRPFVVQSGDVYAEATGTVYSVSRVGETGGTVHVTEGSVLVWQRDERDLAVLVHAGGKLTLDPGPRASQPAPAAAAPRLPPPELAQFSFDKEPIQSAATRFNLVNSTKIVIADPAIGDVRIVGLFRANDPEQFARAAAAVSGGTIEHAQGRIVIKLK